MNCWSAMIGIKGLCLVIQAGAVPTVSQATLGIDFELCGTGPLFHTTDL